MRFPSLLQTLSHRIQLCVLKRNLFACRRRWFLPSRIVVPQEAVVHTCSSVGLVGGGDGVVQSINDSGVAVHIDAQMCPCLSPNAKLRSWEELLQRQADAFAMDVNVDGHMMFWIDARLDRYFESGGRHLDDADPWTASDLPPCNAEEALNLAGPWGCEARGCQVRLCADPRKGKGVFATRALAAAAVVGVYAGEGLTPREYKMRHGGQLARSNAEEQAAEERARALLALPVDAQPMGGVDNRGAYVFSVSTPSTRDLYPEEVAYIDAENPNLSSWCRFINHADQGSHACNMQVRLELNFPRPGALTDSHHAP